jgi:2,3-bisphosphoglycerate-dependent phosphoglycerate mutase
MHILACPPSISILTMKVIPMYLLLLSSRFVESFLAPACGGGRRLVFCQEILPRTKQLTTLFSSSPSVDASDPKKKNGHTTIPSIVGMEEEYEGYARCLSPREERREVEAEFIEGQSKRKALWTRSKSFFLGKLSRRRQQKPGTLILLRCGQSTLNQNATFTGWLDPPLTPLGVEQCRHAGALLRTEGLDPDVVYTSRLQRSIGSAWNLLETLEALYIPIQKTFRLNQRMYGSLQGLSKAQVADECGPQVVQAWRNGLKARPPALSRSDPSHPIWDPRYADLPPDAIPDTESLWDCQERARALWEHKISRDIQRGKTVLVIGHRDSLRGLSKVIDGIDEKHIESIAIPAGVPIVYKFEKGDAMTPMEPDDTSLTQVHTRGSFLEKPGSLQQALAQNQEYEQQAFSAVASKEGYNSTATSSSTRRTNTLETSLLKLRQVEDDLKEDIRLGASFGIGEDDDNVVQLTANATARPVQAERWDDDECEFEEYEYDEFADDAGRNKKDDFVLPVQPLAEDDQPLPNPLLKGPYVVLIRHGRTPHNNMQVRIIIDGGGHLLSSNSSTKSPFSSNFFSSLQDGKIPLWPKEESKMPLMLESYSNGMGLNLTYCIHLG